jgi:tetratricopeptide (TPR) repeat protein
MLFWFWYRRGYFTEGQQWAEKFLAVPVVQDTPRMRALALASSGMMALWQGQQETALGKLQETLAIQQQLEDDPMVATSQMANGIAFINMGRDGDAQPLLQQAGQFFEQAGIDYFHSLTLVHLGNAELGLGHTEQARIYHEDALGKARNINENWLIAFALNNLGEVARTQGQYVIARKYYEECEALLPNSGDTGDRARFVHSLGYIALHEGNYEHAESQFRSSLTMFRRLGNRRGMAECMAGLAALKVREGKAEWGAVMLSAAESVLKGTGGAWWPADRVEVEANQELIRSSLGAAELSAAQNKGRAMTLGQALAFASHFESGRSISVNEPIIV